MLILLLIIITLVISVAILLLSLITREKSIKEREKTTPFECGFSPIKKRRSPFSLRFFVVTLIFLIFDIEIALVLPIGLLAATMRKIKWFITTILILIILIGGLLHEWKNGALNWI